MNTTQMQALIDSQAAEILVLKHALEARTTKRGAHPVTYVAPPKPQWQLDRLAAMAAAKAEAQTTGRVIRIAA